MRLDLLITFGLVMLLSLVFFSIFLKRRGEPIPGRRSASRPPSRLRSDEAAIIESPTYHRTKNSIVALRKSLDEAKESVERLSAIVLRNGDMGTELSGAIQVLRHGLVSAYNHAAATLAAVDEKPDVEKLCLDPDPGPFAPLSADAPRQAHDRLAASLRQMNKAFEICGPGIAGFYLALTDQDERFRVAAASEQMEQMLRVLDSAIKALCVLESELRT
jgi:hypothetical protein